MIESTHQPAFYSRPTDQIRVFLVVANPSALEGLATVLPRPPDGSDLVCVGMQERNTPELPEQVAQTQAEVVLVDLVLGSNVVPRPRPLFPGIEAIAVLRHRFGRNLKIIAYSSWEDLRPAALDAGADAFLSMAAAVAEIRQMIRYVMGRVSSLPPGDR